MSIKDALREICASCEESFIWDEGIMLCEHCKWNITLGGQNKNNISI